MVVETTESYPDIVRLVRSIQKTENNPQCFRTGKSNCEQRVCCWREFCLEATRKNETRSGLESRRRQATDPAVAKSDVLESLE
jgi:hypothetical protein